MHGKQIAYIQNIEEDFPCADWLENINWEQEQLDDREILNITFDTNYPAAFAKFCRNNETELKRLFAEYSKIYQRKHFHISDFLEFQLVMLKRYLKRYVLTTPIKTPKEAENYLKTLNILSKEFDFTIDSYTLNWRKIVTWSDRKFSAEEKTLLNAAVLAHINIIEPEVINNLHDWLMYNVRNQTIQPEELAELAEKYRQGKSSIIIKQNFEKQYPPIYHYIKRVFAALNDSQIIRFHLSLEEAPITLRNFIRDELSSRIGVPIHSNNSNYYYSNGINLDSLNKIMDFLHNNPAISENNLDNISRLIEEAQYNYKTVIDRLESIGNFYGQNLQQTNYKYDLNELFKVINLISFINAGINPADRIDLSDNKIEGSIPEMLKDTLKKSGQEMLIIENYHEIFRSYLNLADLTDLYHRAAAKTPLPSLLKSLAGIKNLAFPAEIKSLLKTDLRKNGQEILIIEYYNFFKDTINTEELKLLCGAILAQPHTALDYRNLLKKFLKAKKKEKAELGQIIELLKSGLSQTKQEILILKNVPNFFQDYLSEAEKIKYYQAAFAREEPLVRSWVKQLSGWLGEGNLRKILLDSRTFWRNIHDNLLFVNAIAKHPPQDQEKIINLVLRPLFSATLDFGSLANLLSSFDINDYLQFQNGQLEPFASLDALSQEVYRQCEHFEIPVTASKPFKEAMNILLKAPGISLDYIKAMVYAYQQYNEDNEDNEDNEYNEYNENLHLHIATLINYIEKKDNVDERQIIKPFSQELLFDPLYKLVYTALGIHGLNKLTPKYIEYFKDENSLGLLLDIFRKADLKTKTELQQKRDAAITADPANKEKYIMTYQKNLSNRIILNLTDGGVVAGINLNSLSDLNFRLAPEEITGLKQILENSLLNSPALRETLQSTLDIFYQKQEAVFNSVDLLGFEPVLSLANKVGKQKDFYIKTLLERSDAHILNLAAFLVYLGFNNKQRQTISTQIKIELDQVLKQKKYMEQGNKLKKNSKMNVFQAYLTGQLELGKEDAEQIKAILLKYGYTEIGRKLKVEICRKSDPRGWVCGDYTDCCMPFGSEQNCQYITREDIAYFIVSLVNPDGSEDLVMQSVLVAATDQAKSREFTTLVIDNIELAHRAVKYRPALIPAYNVLKELYPDKMIVVGTSYNDDGGLLTGHLELKRRTASPLAGKMIYSDWESHLTNYVFHNPHKDNSVQAVKYYGLSIDLLDKSLIKSFVNDKTEMDNITELLETIGQGEDDGEGGLIFPDNYSCVFVKNDLILGYIIVADYVTADNEDDLIIFEKIHLSDQNILSDYLQAKNLENNDNLDGILLKADLLSESPDILPLLEKYYGDKITKKNKHNGDIILKFK
ncbi:hypothetical protein NO1_1469 [Candidatus Termititenax aidoneus]|uniref:Uncharacterized protein n=1 Tax=Termititenax aidoneus TaxID=2218524 RepID=A0A388TBV2_TERA1|nr:hypothetical protein NO1_1469 [Candidatus Termititenax aidoneus]